MALIEIENGAVVASSPLNNNFNYLDGRIDTVGSSISTLQSNLSSLNSTLNSSINSVNTNLSGQITTINASMTEVEGDISGMQNHIDRMVGTPIRIPIVDWTFMNTKAGIATVKTINNANGIVAYGGDQAALNTGDIYLKENFDNYEKIMIVWCPDNASCIGSTIIDSWLFDFLLGSSKAPTSLVNDDYNKGCYWGIYGYSYTYTKSGVDYKTTKKYFLCNGQQNCGILEIYGLTTKEEDAYIVSGSTALSAGWLTDEAGGDAITPQAGVVYTIKTSGTYADKKYHWDGTTYVDITSIVS